jgi:drug/metabolite transporter (DMT)-like permease
MNGKSVDQNAAGAGRAGRLTLIAFGLFVLIGGANSVAVRFSDFELPPFWGAAIRLSAAALIFWAIFIARREALPRGRALVGNVLYGFLGMGAFFALLYWGLVKVPASTTSTILALSPLLTLLFAVAHRLERFRWRGLAGAALALAGIVLGLGGQLGRSAPIPSLLAVAAGIACYSEAAVVFKLFPKSSPTATNAIAFTTGAAMLLVVSLLAGESWFLPSASTTWAAFIYLVLAGSVFLFYIYLFVLARWTASATSYGFLLFPVVGVSLAAWLARETVTPLFLAGSAIVLLGVWVGAFHQPAPTVGEKGSIAARPAATAPEPMPCENC